MRERLLNYMNYMAEITKKTLSPEQKDKVLKDFLIQIKFFQHERLIHLIVTVTFAIIAVVSVLINYTLQSLILLVFILGMLIMLLFYVRHYFFLERGVQKLYTYYDELTKDCRF